MRIPQRGAIGGLGVAPDLMYAEVHPGAVCLNACIFSTRVERYYPVMVSRGASMPKQSGNASLRL
jgi:hypothetical protein